MSNTLTIKIEAPELTQAILKLADSVAGKSKDTTNQDTVPIVPKQLPTQIPAPVQVPTVQAPVVPTAVPVQVSTAQVPVVQPQITTPVPTTAPSYTIEQLQTAIAPLLDAGKVQQIQTLVQSFGVATLMEIPKERYGEFANGLRSLGGVL